jgi:hypothetical protein
MEEITPAADLLCNGRIFRLKIELDLLITTATKNPQVRQSFPTKNSQVWFGVVVKNAKKVLLLFDFACHPCTGTMLIFSV